MIWISRQPRRINIDGVDIPLCLNSLDIFAKRIPYFIVLRWIKQSWREIPEEMVRKSFLTCGISNALDGTEDDAIYEEEQGNDAEEDEMDEEFDTESEDEP